MLSSLPCLVLPVRDCFHSWAAGGLGLHVRKQFPVIMKAEVSPSLAVPQVGRGGERRPPEVTKTSSTGQSRVMEANIKKNIIYYLLY